MYTDDNGIVRFEALDNVAPLQVGLNAALESVSDALGNSIRIFPVGSESERDALVSKYPPSVDKPLYVHRTDKGYVEVSTGDGWGPLPNKAIAGSIRGGDNVTTPNASIVGFVFGSGYEVEVSGGVTANNTGLRVPVAGWYNLYAGIRWQGGGSGGGRQVRLLGGGVTLASVNQSPMSTPGLTTAVTAPLQAGDRVTMEVYQSSGSTLSTATGIGMPMISVAYAGAIA